ncbi:hypothetical protein C8J56DRAFT_1000238 [Mycena floridula]|nr:hypothetical protein C8J56DRAFT_1000238 [Mycena floridula]
MSPMNRKATLRGFWSIKPSRNLVWVECYDSTFQCARLQVPLNHSDSAGDTAAIALIRVPSTLPPTSPEYRGPILFNPGGPGGSGIDFVRQLGLLFSDLLGHEFDIVSFDPRGIGHSTPRVSFYQSAAERAQWNLGHRATINLTDDSASRLFARSQVTNALPKARMARDMLSIVTAHKREKLMFWGFSYGSVLGATFASLFPDRIERLVIDGVVNTEHYYADDQKSGLTDTQTTMQTFFDDCFAAGPSLCGYHASSPAQIAENLEALYDKIRLGPLPVNNGSMYGLVDYSLLRAVIFRSLYKPYTTFMTLAAALRDLETGDGTALYKMGYQDPFECSCNSEGAVDHIQRPETTTTVICNDALNSNYTFEESLEVVQENMEFSPWFDLWSATIGPLICPPIGGNTSYPLLLCSSYYLFTYAVRALAISQLFPGSVVLSQDSAGHCSLAAPSTCTQSYIRDYFVHGTLPKPNTWCPVTRSTFSPSAFESQDQNQQIISVEEDRSEKLRRAFEASRSVFPL